MGTMVTEEDATKDKALCTRLKEEQLGPFKQEVREKKKD